MYKNQKILIKSEKHFNEVAYHLELLGYKKYSIEVVFSPHNINFIVAYRDGYYNSLWTKEAFDKDPYEEVELIIKVTEDGEVCTFLKTVEKKKFGFDVNDGYLVVTNKNGMILAYVLNLKTMKYSRNVKSTLEELGYDTADYKWNDNGSIATYW